MITVTIAANEIKKNLILMTVSSNNWRWTISISIIFIFGKWYWVESSEVVAKCCRCRKQISEVFRDCFDYFPHKIHKFLSISSIEFHYKEKKISIRNIWHRISAINNFMCLKATEVIHEYLFLVKNSSAICRR